MNSKSISLFPAPTIHKLYPLMQFHLTEEPVYFKSESFSSFTTSLAFHFSSLVS